MTRFVHRGLTYSSDRELLAGTVPFLRAGERAGDLLCSVLLPANMEILRGGLEGAAARVEYIDARGWYVNPTRTLNAYRGYLLTARGRPVRVVAEIGWDGRTPRQVSEWKKYEALVNVGLAEFDARIVCAYDTRALPPDLVAEASRTHPETVRGDRATVNGDYVAPAEFAAYCDRDPLPPPPASATTITFDRDGLRRVRTVVSALAVAAGMPADSVDELAFALNELASNAIRHGSTRALLLAWRHDGSIVCEIRNDAPLLGAHYAGYFPPAADSLNGRGLWLTRQLYDDLELRSDAAGTTARLRVPVGA